MKTCPKCKTTGLPEEAKFCPNCGASLTPAESTKRMTISECRLVPNTIKNGEQCKLVWKGENVDSITIEGRIYKPNDDIVLSPIQSYVYNVSFKGKDGKQIVNQVSVTVQKLMTVSECRIVPDAVCEGEQCKLYWKGENVEFIEVNSIRYKANEEIVFTPSQSYTCNVSFYGEGGSCISKQVLIVVEKCSHIVFIKSELSRIGAYDTDLKCLKLILNGECVAYTEMRPYYSKEIVVKNGDYIKLIGESSEWGFERKLFELTVTNEILSKKKYYLEFVKEFLSVGEADFHAASY